MFRPGLNPPPHILLRDLPGSLHNRWLVHQLILRASTGDQRNQQVKVSHYREGHQYFEGHQSARRAALPTALEIPVKLSNLKITPKLGILVGVTLIGLCAAGILAINLIQREMTNSRIDQVKSMVEMVKNYAGSLKKDVDAGKMTKEAALAELGKRANQMTYDNGSGYIFGTSYDGITLDRKSVG